MDTINLESGFPIVCDAMSRLECELDRLMSKQSRFVVVIHGYGSSGQGGKIKSQTQIELMNMKKIGYIKNFVKGENFSMSLDIARNMYYSCPDLSKYYDKHNRGVTIVQIF